MLSDGVERRNGSVTTRSGNLSGDKQCEMRPTYGLRSAGRGGFATGPSPDPKRQTVAEHSCGIDPDDDLPVRSGRFPPWKRQVEAERPQERVNTLRFEPWVGGTPSSLEDMAPPPAFPPLGASVEEVPVHMHGDGVTDSVRLVNIWRRSWRALKMFESLVVAAHQEEGSFPSRILVAPFEAFTQGDWCRLMGASRICDEQTAQSRGRDRRRAQDNLELGAIRAGRLEQVGELSSGQAMEGAALARATLRQLTDATKRLPQPREPLPQKC